MTDNYEEDGWKSYISNDGEYHVTGYRGAFNAGFDAAMKTLQNLFVEAKKEEK